MKNTYIIGKKGEANAEDFLKQNGYKIIDRNFYTKLGEIDLIAMDKSVLCFVEVKEKSSKKFGLPREMVTLTKQHKIRMVAELYLKINPTKSPIRFDVVDVLNDEITLIKNAF